MRLAVGVDTGGTFTDLVVFDLDNPTSSLAALKVPSTPEDPSLAFEAALSGAVALTGAPWSSFIAVTHGTTVGTNALLEDHLALTGLITTDGFRDVVDIARQRRPHLYDLSVPKPTPIAPRNLRFEVIERVDHRGEILTPIDEPQLHTAIESFAAASVESIAICLLHSYANPEHELKIRETVERVLPGVVVCTSSEVMPEWREYERFSTTLVNASLMPIIGKYLSKLEERLRRLGVPAAARILQSNGGLGSVKRVARLPIGSLASGPSAGVIGAVAIGHSLGNEDLITVDVGGTSTDVCLVKGGKPDFVHTRHVAGHPVKLDSLAIQSVGAGGGSVVSVDEGGFLQVGPESTGADPGPACYGRGGVRPTITDANVIIGTLESGTKLGKSVEVRGELAREAFEPIAAQLKCGIAEAAAMALKIMTLNIARAVKLISLDRGHDPRDFALTAYGGAGPMHAAQVAAQLGMDLFIVPPAPGVLCAFGLLHAPFRADFTRTALTEIDAANSSEELNALFADLEARAQKELAEEGEDVSALEMSWSADMSFLGQDHELTVAVPGSGRAVEVTALDTAFRDSYQRAYGYLPPTARTRVVNCRVTARGEPALSRISGSPAPLNLSLSDDVGMASRDVFFEEANGWIATTVCQASVLEVGLDLEGPVIVEGDDSTTVIPPGWSGTTHPNGSLIVKREA
jgi:N-methylhydantoinase A